MERRTKKSNRGIYNILEPELGYWIIAISILGLVYCFGNIVMAFIRPTTPYPIFSHYEFYYAGLLRANDKTPTESSE